MTLAQPLRGGTEGAGILKEAVDHRTATRHRSITRPEGVEVGLQLRDGWMTGKDGGFEVVARCPG